MAGDDRDYRERVRLEVEQWKAKKPSRVVATLSKPAEFLGYPIKKLLDTGRGRAILERVVTLLFEAGTWRQDRKKIIETYRSMGHEVASLADIRAVVPLNSKDEEAKKHWIAATAALSVEGGIVGPAMAAAATAAGGAAAALAMASGGAGGPAAAAAGLAVVATVTITETTFLIGFCARRLASIAACYGFDVSDDRERAFALQVFNVATAENLEAKQAALADLGHLAGQLGLKNQPWKNLEDTSVIATIIRELADRIGWKITQAQLRRVLTVVGAAMGAGFNGHLGHSVTRAGYMIYRERTLDGFDVEESVVDAEVVEPPPSRSSPREAAKLPRASSGDVKRP